MGLNSHLLGLDIGGTKCAAVIGTAEGKIIDRIEWPSDTERGPGRMIEQIGDAAQQLIDRHGPPAAIGVSIGGPLDAGRGVILSPPNLPGWNAIPLKDILQRRFSLPVAVEHDAAACCLAEHKWGAGRGAARVIYLTCGTGFGVGIVIDGSIYRGARGRSLEIGHARYRDHGPEGFGKAGSVEGYCAGASLPKLAAFLYPRRWGRNAPSPAELAELAKQSDDDAAHVLRVNAQAIGDVCAMLGDLLRPDQIILGSLARHLGAAWVRMIMDRFVAEALADTTACCVIEPAGLGPQLQDCSALVVALQAAATPH